MEGIDPRQSMYIEIGEANRVIFGFVVACSKVETWALGSDGNVS
jgi:hypothetical protein